LLAVPMIVFGGNHFVSIFALPPGDGSVGATMLETMRGGGLMGPIALSHVAIGILLLVPRSRFAGALLQLPMSLGILAFHMTMLPEGTPLALILVALNACVLSEPDQIRSLFRTASAG
ncbi:MAG: hypothetical protein ACI841_004693, partial [Planctomycetota bacterium]